MPLKNQVALRYVGAEQRYAALVDADSVARLRV